MSTKKIGQIKRICWACGLGDCDGPLEKEHVVSKNLLKYFGTLGFTKDGVRRSFGINKHVVRNLCAKHNRALSTYDEEAKKLFEGWHKLWIQKESEHFERSHNGQIILKVDGKKIERWLAKTFINCLIFEASLSLHENLTYFPSAQSLVSAIFSDDDFSSPYGLYIVKPWKQMYPNESRRLNWTLKIQHEKTRHYHSEKHIWKDYVLPTFIWVGFAGVEIIGVFNPTVYKNEFHQTCLKQYYESFLPDRADYHQHMIGFNRDNDKDLGPQGPARIIQFEW